MDNTHSTNQNNGLEIAIIGMACRFPGAKNVQEFWHNIQAGVESITFFNDEELLAAGVDQELLQNPSYVKANGIIDDIELFDASFFGYSPREVALIDPQQRIFLECAVEALEQAGYDTTRYDKPVGVYASSALSTYFLNNIYPYHSAFSSTNVLQDFIANGQDFLATRVAYKLNLRGPALVVQTACSSSLVAVHLACQGLLSGECSMALAGGVSIRVPQQAGYLYQQGSTFSPDGHCRTFDAQAQGTVFGNGAGIVVLKRLEEALADNDTIHAVIKGSAINNDGAFKVGYTAPSIEGQAAAIRNALAIADIEPDSVSYVEAHGTATPVGDPIEVAALTQAFRAGTRRSQFCALGSVKTNIGHLDAAAGVAGLIKTVYALKYRQLPPSLHFQAVNPAIDLEQSPFYVNTKLVPWNTEEGPRRAGISSFGIGGTNAHMILEEAPAIVSSTPATRPWHILAVSARSASALEQAHQDLALLLQQRPQEELADVAYTLQVGRREFPHRSVVVCEGSAEAVHLLSKSDPGRLLYSVASNVAPRVVFLFPGQGSQYIDMGRDLYQQEEVFRSVVDHCSELLRPHLGADLRTYLFPPENMREEAQRQLNETWLTQPALFVIEYALAKLWRAWGIEPTASIGHSLGEYVAACLANVLTIEDALRLVALRGRLMQQVSSGAMLAVQLSNREIEAFLEEGLSIAAINTPQQCVIAGEVEKIQALADRLRARNIACRRLRTSHAFHSPLIEPTQGAFGQLLNTIPFQAPRIPYISGVTGTWITPAQATDPAYWLQQQRLPVRFSDGVQELLRLVEPQDESLSEEIVFLEVGPGHTLSSFVAQHRSDKIRYTTIASLPGATERTSAMHFLMTSLGNLWLKGVAIQWDNLYTRERRQRIPLPTYPFERQSYWVDPPQTSSAKELSLPFSNDAASEEIVAVSSLHSTRPELATTYAEPRNQYERSIADIWQQLLGIEPIGIYDNFFDLGGHSLLASQIMARLRSHLHVDLSLRELFEAANIAELAQRVEAATTQIGEVGVVPPLTSVKRSDRLPLSFAQRRLWFLHQMEQGKSSFYNIPNAVSIRGPLQFASLKHNLDMAILRHEALHTIFALKDEEPAQIIVPQTVALPVIDLQMLSGQPQATELQRLATNEAQALFDLSQGPLIRVTLVRLKEQEHVLLLTLHHIISDGWSIGLLVHELLDHNDVYEICSRPALSLQYADYAIWQHQWLQSEALSSQLAYWKGQLAGPLPVLDIALDHSRLPAQTYRGVHVPFHLPDSLVEQMKALGQQEDATLFMVLCAAFQVLLYRYSGQEDICVGTPVANRPHPELEPLIGMFINTLVLRSDFSGSPDFLEVLRRVREVCLQAYAHQDVPFEKLVEVLQPERDLSRSPLFQAMFVLQNSPLPPTRLGNLSLELLETESGTALFDLTMFLIETDREIRGRLEYNTDLFEASTIQRILTHWFTLLHAIVARPSSPIAHLPLLTPQEHDLLVRTFNATQTAWPSTVSVPQLIVAQVARTPDTIALSFEESQLTYSVLLATASRLAHALLRQGLKPEGLVAICLERSQELVMALLAVELAGGAYVPLDPSYPLPRLHMMLCDTHSDFLLTQTALLPHLPAEALPDKVICLDGVQSLATLPTEANPPKVTILLDQLAYVIYTSGSTGVPKGAMNTHRAFCNRLLWMQQALALTTEDRVMQKTPISFDVSVWEFFWPLLVGARLVLATPGDHRDSTYLCQLIQEQQITTLHFVPSMLQVFLEDPQVCRCGSLRTVVCSGEALSPDLQQRFYAHLGANLYNLYGPTEAAIDVSAWACEPGSQGERVPIGRPIANLRLYILDKQGQVAPIGVPGELFIGGVGVGRGYWQQAALSAERFVPDPYSEQRGERLYRTGDRARYREDGAIEFLGRMDFQVKIRGQRIEPGEIEAVLGKQEGVRECVVQAQEWRAGQLRLVAYVVVAQGIEGEAMRQRWREGLRSQLPEAMVPTHFVLLDQLPLGPNGKLDRRTLPLPEWKNGESETSFVAPASPVEQILADYWAQILGVEHISAYDNFFNLGGHSLLAMQVMVRLRKALSIELPLRSLFESSNLRELARIIESIQAGEREKALPALTKIEHTDKVPLSFAQQRIWFLDQLESANTAYIVPLAIHIRGSIDSTLLEHSLQSIIERHESLRTIITTIDGQPVQIVEPDTTFVLEQEYHHLSMEAGEEYISDLLREETQTPFHFADGPLFRARFLHFSEDEHILLVTMHHIITDGWSSGIFMRELLTLYLALRDDRPALLPALPIQYADYTLWQRQWLQGDELQRQLAYWTQQLAGATPLDLPTDHPHPPVRNFRGASQRVHLPASLVESLRQLGQSEGATLFMTLLTAFKVLLMRYSGQEDLSIGIPITNRNQTELELLIGLFVNTLVVRSDLSGAPAFVEALRRVREVCLQAYAHQDLPFEKLVEELQPERDLSRSPLFQVMFVLQDAPLPSAHIEGITLNILATESQSAKFDITLELFETGEDIQGRIEYNTELFEASTIQRLLAHWITLLHAIVEQPTCPITRLPLLPPDEQEQLLHIFNATQQHWPTEMSVPQLIVAQAQRTPEAIALCLEECQLSYAALLARASLLAHHLLQEGLRPEGLVVICLERSLELVIGLLGVWLAGGVYVPLDPSSPRQRLRLLLEETQSPFLLTHASLRDRLPVEGLPNKLFCLEDLVSKPTVPVHSTETLPDILPEQLAYVIYTSGSTGTPKGAMNAHRGLCNRLLWMQQAFMLTPRDRVVHKTPISFDVSVWELTWPLLQGACLVLAVPEGHRDSAYLCHLIEEQQITTVHFVPSLLQALLYEPHLERCVSLRTVICSGEALPWDVQQRFLAHLPARLYNLYGPTEAAIDVSYWACDAHDESRVVPIGRPIANLRLYVLDEQGQPAPIGVPGELFIGGIGVGRGYWQRPALSAERFVPDPYSEQGGERLYQTGDRARYREDGAIEFLGRRDFQVKIRGQRIELGEIEAVLGQQEGVRECVVQAQKGPGGQLRLVAYVVAQGEEEEGRQQHWRRALREQLPEVMIPAHFMLLEHLPLSPNGKLDRRALPVPDWRLAEREMSFVAPRTNTEKILADIWSNILGVKPVGIYDNFFALGGDSILSIRIIAHASQMGLHLTVEQLFQHQTIAELSEQTTTGTIIQAEQGLVRGPVPLTPIQHWFFSQPQSEPHHFNQTMHFEALVPLDGVLLREAIGRLLVHHDALRLRFTPCGTHWQQTNAEPDGEIPFVHIDLTEIDYQTQEQAIRRIEEHTQASLNISQGPLLRVVLFSFGGRLADLLLMAIHHASVDGVSWQILLEDLQSLYLKLQRGEPLQLPPKTTSYQQWSERLQAYAGTETLLREMIYWLAGPWERVRPLPVDFSESAGQNLVAYENTVVAALSAAETRILLGRLPQVYQAQIQEILFAALAQAITTWTDTTTLLVDVEGHGREDILEDVNVTRTVGWFTALFPVCIDLMGTTTAHDIIQAVQKRLRQMPWHGVGYGILRYLSEESTAVTALRALPRAEIVFNYLGQFDRLLANSELFRWVHKETRLSQSPRRMRTHLFEINCGIRDEQFCVLWSYSDRLHRHSTIERLAAMFIESLRAFIADYQAIESEGDIPTDFPELRLDNEDSIASQGMAIAPITPAERNGASPLSFAQQRLWLLYRLRPEDTSYNITRAIQIQGPLQFAALHNSLLAVVSRHEILRTTFNQVGEQAVQVIAPSLYIPLVCLDLQMLTQDEQEREILRLIDQEDQHRFNPTQGPLMCVHLLRLSATQHVLLYVIHHIIFDVWSEGIFLHELDTLYTALLAGEPSPLPALPVQYADYACWQQKHLSQKQMEKHLNYWQRQLSGAATLDLPTDLHHKPAHSFKGATRVFELSQNLSHDIALLSKRENVTVFMALLSAFNVLLHRLTGQEDIVVGTDITTRTQAETEALIGFFVNLLVLRTNLAGDLPFNSVLQQVRKVVLEAYEHQDLPFDKLVEILQPDRSLHQIPLVRALFVFQNTPMPPLKIADLNLSLMEFTQHTAKFDLAIFMWEGAQGLVGTVNYSTDLYDAGTIDILIERFQLLLQSIVKRPGALLSEFDIFTSQEKADNEQLRADRRNKHRQKLRSIRRSNVDLL